MRLLYLPTYSPDLNPIEEAFSSIKAWLCANRDYVLGELMGEPQCDPYAMLCHVIFTVTPDKAYSWYRHSGYIL
ncbi:hypothetical protein K435DRAFT_723311 [Dendrothele bispora CBS 962.96]|uniref:Tc1-like transposase DDE domain-containing protein n=1 Tax=Dendrothele bispora (strain CBS 962.96) TaxID=1314807 RepID=A0A4V4HFQ4_DENBC|nr:hypothetical protein K435DRAFT_723311 [Dendrothele bispora CBS 962.96]